MADRYRVLGEIGAGGMATVELGELVGPIGFSRLVAIKRLHSQLSNDPELVAMFVDEARLAARVRHPNVVSTLDVVQDDGELFLVLDYVHGDSLARILRASGPIRPDLAAAIVLGLLHGLHAAHEAVGAGGVPLEIVHRDVSPENVLVGADGVARLADFGIAKARHRLRTTMDGSVRGKLPYMAPEQLILSGEIDRRTDVYATSVVLWELLTGRVPLTSADIGSILGGGARPAVAAPSTCGAGAIGSELDAVVLRGMSPASDERFATAMEMATALERAQSPASQRELSEWVREVAGPTLQRRDLLIEDLEARPRATTTSLRQRGRELSSRDTVSQVRGAAPAGIATAPCSEGTLPEPAAAPTVRMDQEVAQQPAPLPPTRRSRASIAMALVALAASLVVAGASAKWIASRSSEAATTAAPPAIDVAPRPTAELAALPPLPPVVETAFVAPAPAIAPASLRTQAPPHKKSAVAPRVAPAASAGGACQVPFRVDDDGVRIPKPGCW